MVTKIIKILLQGEDQASEQIGNVKKTLGGLGKAALGAGAVGVGAMAGIGAGAIKLAIDAAPLADIRDAFEGIAKASGLTAEDVLKDFKSSTHGMLSNADAMASYNEAAQLVGPTFANQLPEAMEYLSKVAASTGGDVDYMVDSLVTGIGRLSPQILDNLKIQVDLAQAYADWSAETGIAVDEMTKQEQQAALTAQVMTLLSENTAALPEVVGGATQRMAAMNATMTDLKDSVGIALQPALVALLEPLGALATEYGPAVTEWLSVAAEWLGEKLPPAIAGLSEFLSETLAPALEKVAGFIRDNATPILAALGAILALTVVPAFIAWAAAAVASGAATILALAPVVLPIMAIAGAVALLVKAWESDWGGIRTTLTDVWDNKLKPIFEAVKAWLDVNIPAAIATLKGVWDNTLKPILDGIKGAFNSVKDAISGVIDWFGSLIGKIGEIRLPDWLTPGSPTPFELGLRGISSAMRDLSRSELPTLRSSLSLAGIPGGRMARRMGAGGGGTVQVTNYFGKDSIRSERDILRVVELQERSLQLRGVRSV